MYCSTVISKTGNDQRSVKAYPIDSWIAATRLVCPLFLIESFISSFSVPFFIDYDQLLNKRPGKNDAVFSWHQDMGYWPSAKVLGVEETSTCTFSLAVDDSMKENGCLRYVVGSHKSKTLRPHKPLVDSRDDGHALTIDVDEAKGDVVKLAPASRGSITIHDEFVVHGSGGNTCMDKQRRTYVVAFRPKKVVDAERQIGFTHSHNDEVNWDTFEENAQ